MSEKLVQLKKKGGGGSGINSMGPLIPEHIYSTDTWLTQQVSEPLIGLVAYPSSANGDYSGDDILATWYADEGYNVTKSGTYRNRTTGVTSTLQIKVVDATTIQYRINGDSNYITRYGAYVYLMPIY